MAAIPDQCGQRYQWDRAGLAALPASLEKVSFAIGKKSLKIQSNGPNPGNKKLCSALLLLGGSFWSSCSSLCLFVSLCTSCLLVSLLVQASDLADKHWALEERAGQGPQPWTQLLTDHLEERGEGF